MVAESGIEQTKRDGRVPQMYQQKCGSSRSGLSSSCWRTQDSFNRTQKSSSKIYLEKWIISHSYGAWRSYHYMVMFSLIAFLLLVPKPSLATVKIWPTERQLDNEDAVILVHLPSQWWDPRQNLVWDHPLPSLRIHAANKWKFLRKTQGLHYSIPIIH